MKLFIIFLFAVSIAFAGNELEKIKKATVKSDRNDNNTVMINKNLDKTKNKKSKISLGVEATTEFHSVKIKRK